MDYVISLYSFCKKNAGKHKREVMFVSLPFCLSVYLVSEISDREFRKFLVSVKPCNVGLLFWCDTYRWDKIHVWQGAQMQFLSCLETFVLQNITYTVSN
jgi:hypothetical protein